MKKNISASLEKNLQDLQTEFDNSADLMIRRMQVCGVPAALVSMEGLVNKLNIAESILNPILQAELEEKNPDVVILSNELGYGVVPVDQFDRAYREKTGRVCCKVAQAAQEVHRVVCGLGTVIKHG